MNSTNNPDERPLPPGWISQYDKKFYVNTSENPPRSSWTHPLGPKPVSQYNPPSGPPPTQKAVYSNQQPQYPPQQWSSPPQQWNGPPQQWNGPPQQQWYPPQQQWSGGGYYQPQYQQPRKSGMGGMAMPLGAGAAGLVGGMLLADAYDDRMDDAYRDGYENGQDNANDNDGDFGGDGGDFDGGDY